MNLGPRCLCGSPATHDNDSSCGACYRAACLARASSKQGTLDGLILRVNAWCRDHEALVVNIGGAYFQGWQVEVRFSPYDATWRTVGQTHDAVLAELELIRKRSAGIPLDRFEVWPKNARGELVCNYQHPMPEDRPSTGLVWSHVEIASGPVFNGRCEHYRCAACGLLFKEAGT